MLFFARSTVFFLVFWGAPYVVRLDGEFCRGHSQNRLGFIPCPLRKSPSMVGFPRHTLTMALGIFEKIYLAIWRYEEQLFGDLCSL